MFLLFLSVLPLFVSSFFLSPSLLLPAFLLIFLLLCFFSFHLSRKIWSPKPQTSIRANVGSNLGRNPGSYEPDIPLFYSDNRYECR
jgi:hypothetical protein